MRSEFFSPFEPERVRKFFLRRTLDVLSHIHLSDCCLDTPALLSCHANDYIWILHRAKSNTLQAWHPISHQLAATICLNQIFDRLGKSDEQLALINDLSASEEQRDELINEISISSFLISDEQMWIGTSTGILYVFDYRFRSSNNKRSSPWDSGLSWTENESPADLFEQRSISHQSTSTLTSIESSATSRSSLPPTDESDDDMPAKSPTTKRAERPTIGLLDLELSFKAKIADSPVKYLSRTTSLPLLISCSGQLGDDEIVCQWHRIGNTVGFLCCFFFCSSTKVFFSSLESMDERRHRRISNGNALTHSSPLCLPRISTQRRFQGVQDRLTVSFVRVFYTD